ncbi:uncharacterized protein FIBRA_01273 [Fibroporia radiculosa]|uniref:Pop1 N-terminal domain-containing protein n=1 Tax=Fibroporia radiculosa TaxID=599839 RepID=J4G0W4_9APHY|nr:uncharacterized protein FIBRA_01273 [Fibroporia radiculosa]CCL99258.1 predicted protein [Fibroporia radiculosa]
MPPKRKNGSEAGYEEPTARERKKQKTAIARTIAVQPDTSAAKNTSNAVAGSSKSVRFDSMQGLPGSLDVERFAEARAFEINAMHQAMQNARASSTQRAWQQLPRHLRRRAASHDVRRVPLRLRDKARAEMDPMRRKALGRSMPKQGSAKRVKRTLQLLRRQRDKTWLETHIWHAKRMKMENMWGYRLAIEPTEKSFRPSHRASVHGSILHDASYFALVELRGPEDIIRAILDACCDCQGPSAGAKRSLFISNANGRASDQFARFLAGARAYETHIYSYGSYPFGLISPVSIIWRPVCRLNEATSQPEFLESAPTDAPSKRKRKGKGKGKEKERNEPLLARTVWLRVHPSVIVEVHQTLRTAASFALESAKEAGREELEIEITDLREHVNAFEITGPKANQILKGALRPVKDSQRTEFNAVCALIGNDSSPYSDQITVLELIEPNSNNGLTSTGHDNRFYSSRSTSKVNCVILHHSISLFVSVFKLTDNYSFPPKNAKIEYGSDAPLSSPPNLFPSAALAQCEIWDESIRDGLRKPRYKKKDIDQRRSKNLVPGTELHAVHKDDRIPVLLIQRSIEGSSSSPTFSGERTGNSPSLHGWTLIIPSGWAMPFFSSLIYTGTRVGGQRERQTQVFEGGGAYFPRDYPSTETYAEYADGREVVEHSRWERKPPAKRTNFEKLGTRSPWKPDWEVVLGLQAPSRPPPSDELISAQREDVPMETDNASVSTTKKDHMWLLRGANVAAILQNVSSMFNPAAGLLDHMSQLRMKRGQNPLDSRIRADDLWKSALILVNVLLCGRGNPEDLAVIYRLDDVEAKKWYDAERIRKMGAGLQQEEENEHELSKLAPSQDAIIGYVTTGHYSLSRGEGHAIGAIPVRRLFELRQQAERLRVGPSLLVKVRDRGDTTFRRNPS